MSYTLTLYFYPSPYGVDWRSPFHLTWSAIRNFISFKPRMIGHVSVELSANKLTEFFTGMSTKQFDQNKKLLLKDGLALGILFHQYVGHLENSDDLVAERDERFASNAFSFVKFSLSEESYMKVHRYLTEYQEQKKQLWYGLPNRPRFGEGAGCSAFAASCLEVAGILEEEFKKNWSGVVRAPEELIGNKKQKVSIFKLIFPHSGSLRWASESENARTIFFWDPDRMHQWVLKKHAQEILDTRYKKLKMKETIGLSADFSDRKPSAESIWL